MTEERAELSPIDSELPEFGHAALQITETDQHAGSASLELLRLHGNVAEYVFRIYNPVDSQILCLIYGNVRDGKQEPLHPPALWIPPRAVWTSAIRVPLRWWRPFGRVTVDVRSRFSNYVLEANVPKARFNVWQPVGLAAIAVLLVIASFLALRPHIDAFAVPSRVLAGDVAIAGYAAGGLGKLRYTVQDATGKIIRGSDLAARTGTIAFPTGQSDTGQSYTLHLYERGPLGAADVAQAFSTVPLPQPRLVLAAVPKIESFGVDQADVESGKPIVIRYASNGTQGQIRLLDAQGFTLSRLPVGGSGVTELTAPSVQQTKDLRVEYTAQRASVSTQENLGITVHPPAPAQPSPQVAGAENPVTISSGDVPQDPIALEQQTVVGGTYLRVAILNHLDHLHLALQTPQGNIINQVAVPPTIATMQILVPRVKSDTDYVLVAAYRNGVAQQSVVRSVHVLAH